MVLGLLDICRQKMNLSLSLMPYTKVNCKGIMDVNVKCKTIKPSGKNWEEILGIQGQAKSS